MIRIENLKVTFGQQVALDIPQTLEFKQGQRIGIIGGNGAGKTTLINAILDLVPYQGKIERSLPVSQMAVHLQYNEFVDTMSCQHVMEAILNTKIKKNPDLQELIDFFEMGDHLKKKYKHLSGGQKQRFTLIMVLFQKAELTFFDEVTSGLDSETRQRLVKKIRDWYQGSDATFCMVSHYYEELENLVDQIVLLDQGKLVAYGDKLDLFQKYCGKRVVMIGDRPGHQEVIASYQQILGPEGVLAISVNSDQEEMALIEKLVVHNIDYRRTSLDIELMTINAKATFLAKEGQ